MSSQDDVKPLVVSAPGLLGPPTTTRAGAPRCPRAALAGAGCGSVHPRRLARPAPPGTSCAVPGSHAAWHARGFHCYRAVQCLPLPSLGVPPSHPPSHLPSQGARAPPPGAPCRPAAPPCAQPQRPGAPPLPAGSPRRNRRPPSTVLAAARRALPLPVPPPLALALALRLPLPPAPGPAAAPAAALPLPLPLAHKPWAQYYLSPYNIIIASGRAPLPLHAPLPLPLPLHAPLPLPLPLPLHALLPLRPKF